MRADGGQNKKMSAKHYDLSALDKTWIWAQEVHEGEGVTEKL